MYQERTHYVIPLILICLAVVVGFAFIISPGSASAGSDALIEDILGGGSVEGTVVLDDYFVINSGTETGHHFWGYTLTDPSVDNTNGGAMLVGNIADLQLKAYRYLSNNVDGGYTYTVFNSAGLISGTARGYMIDAAGKRIDFTVSCTSNPTTNGRYATFSITPTADSPTTFSYYPRNTNPYPLTNLKSAGGYANVRTAQPQFLHGSDYLGIQELCIYSVSDYGFGVTVGGNGYYMESTLDRDDSQHLYCMGAEDKYYLWLFREGMGSSIIIEGKATVGIPAVTITNGGRYYTDNYFVSLDKYDTFGVEYGYSIQMSAFDSSSQIVTQTFTFGERGSTPGGSDDPIIIPPSIIEIPESLHTLIATPGQLPSLDLPFDFTPPTFTIDLTSGFDTAFNTTWLGVNGAYTSTKEGIDSFVSNFAPRLDGLFGDVVFTITTYVDSFKTACEELKDTYAVPFFNLMVRISALVPSPVWIIFDIWLVYCAVRLVIHIFTCPLADVIRRSI